MRIEDERITTLLDKLNIEGVTLLSTEEAKRLPNEIRDIHKCWWLRSPGPDDFNRYAVAVFDSGIIHHYGIRVDYCENIRPALIFKPSPNLNIEDVFMIAGYKWTVINDHMAICNKCIGKSCFRRKWQEPDANIYEKSDIKKFIDDWARENGIVQQKDR